MEKTINFHVLEWRPIVNSDHRVKGELKDWLIKKGLNPKKYIEVSLPVFQFFYIKENQACSQSCSVDSYLISDINIKELEYSDNIYIYKPDYSYSNILNDELRIYPIVASDDYKRWLRARKLDRILWQED